MSNEASSSRASALPPSIHTQRVETTPDPYSRLSFEPASQAQILRAHQRDSGQVRRLIELVSESLRSLVGTRWIAHRQAMIDVAVRAAYLILTLGRGRQTLGEEYTDITPFASGRRRMPGRARRILTILFLLSPSVLTNSAVSAYLRGSSTSSAWGRIRHRLASALESPLAQSLPELHMIGFLMSGRFFEFGRRLTGTSYVSTQAPRPPERRQASYEPLAILLALPILFRLLTHRPSSSLDVTSSSALAAPAPHLQVDNPLLPLTSDLSAEQTLLLTKSSDYDTPNTYLTPGAQQLPERQCTLCLEPRGTGEGSGGTVAVTECGHIFCWGCLGGLEKPYTQAAQRYPSGLSQGQGGPSRRPIRSTHTSSSVDDEVPPPPLPLPLPQPQLKKSASRPLNPNSKPYTPQNLRSHQDLRSEYSRQNQPEPTYASIPPPEAFRLQEQQQQLQYQAYPRPEFSSLQHLLEQAGYADTRIATPPAERIGRRIKKTFDEVDAEEVRDLYSTFGMAEHRVTHVTEPGLPLKSSSSLLRNLALQDSNYVNQAEYEQQQSPSPQFGTSYDTWWGGGFAALGRAAKAVMEMSPPSKGAERFEEVAAQMSSSIGLGLARGGEGVRKVKSNWELGRSEMDQEQIAAAEYVPARRPRVLTGISSLADLPPAAMADQDEFGFSPLPADYEAQCDDDEFFTTSFDVGSLGSTPFDRSRESSAEPVVDDDAEDSLFQQQLDEVNQVNLESPDSVRSLGFGLSRRGTYGLGMGGVDVGRRIMAEAVDYDEYDHESPTKGSFIKALPVVVAEEAKAEDVEVAIQPELIMPTPVVEAAPPVRKYADRATKLRLARSTPILTRAPPTGTSGWLGSIRNFINATDLSSSTYASIPADPNPSSSKPAPIKLSPALPAIPALAKPVAVVCDSSSDMAEDLPAIPQTITTAAAPGPIASIALRTRKSLAHLRSVVYGSAPPVPPLPVRSASSDSADSSAPVLSPRLDLAESEYFAGWSPRRPAKAEQPTWATPTKRDSQEDGYGPTEIDYTRSFFYKPCTPPSAAASSSTYTAIANVTPTSASTDYAYSSTSSTVPANLVARRQRSIKSLRAALLLPVAPPVPSIPAQFTGTVRSTSAQSASTVSTSAVTTPPQKAGARMGDDAPPVIAILSPGAWEAGLPARQLLLEGEEWDARDGLGSVGDWGRGKGKPKGKLRRKGSKKAVRE
ncbi:Pex12 amino terminal region-domain-containing protein [Dioszegia hungarica]|uniref:RING-type E3 ubiquitin transferase n=1 Tax=Dioszegia hungarica TaxID=4972 RepID=A0AA38H4F9_9TREE|nr:Pex12 amino terminal region-domain-containing protein [Dioszegia hungarica]KAI9632319.1 Pex12 amino terminal region-domain-containing protein [Dioszegia hungarica]